MRELVIARGSAIAWLDDEDFDSISKHSWQVDEKGYARRTVGKKHKHTIRMHRQVLGLTVRDPQVDHIDRNKLNNQKHNLRLATQHQNRQNLASYEGSSSRYRGVSWHRKMQKWTANARLNGKLHWLGSYDTEKEAAQAAVEWRQKNMPYSTD